MGLLTIFANFRIDSEERMMRMIDSYRSFSDSDVGNWVINIRGPWKDKAAAFLEDALGSKLKLYSLASSEGWFHDSRRMLSDIDADYVFFWIEDHVNTNKEPKILNTICSELKRCDVDSLLYSWHFYREAYRNIARTRIDMIEWSDLKEVARFV